MKDLGSNSLSICLENVGDNKNVSGVFIHGMISINNPFKYFLHIEECSFFFF